MTTSSLLCLGYLWVRKLHSHDAVVDTSRLYHIIKKLCLCLQGSSSMLWDPAQAYLFKAEVLCYLKVLGGRRFQSSHYKSRDPQPLIVQNGMWSQQVVRSVIGGTLNAFLSQKQLYGKHARCL